MIGTKGITATQAEAIRHFFTQPQKQYSEAETRAIFGDSPFNDGDDPAPYPADLLFEILVSDTDTFPPTLPGVVLGDAAPEALRLERLTIDLPSWQVRALERFAEAINGTISDAIAAELHMAHGPSEPIAESTEAFEGAGPRYSEAFAVRKPFAHVSEITDEVAEAFVDALFDNWDQSSGVTLAISESGAMTWPEAPDSHIGVCPTDEQAEYENTQDAIVDELEELLRPTIAQAFRAAATKALGLSTGSTKRAEGDRR